MTGDAHDAQRAALARSGTNLATLAQTVALASPAAPVAALGPVVSLPADRLLAPAATNCAALRSGRHRIVVGESGGTAPSTALLDINAQALAMTGNGETNTPISSPPAAIRPPPTITCTANA